ncbi:MAG: glycosyltransferase [Candidatus Latescibacteria bacterium]|nr:glycosyltransferase [Candidatus Latescibacterota bacterium]
MALLTPALICATAVYVCVALLFLVGLFRTRTGKSKARPFVSVIVAARDEEAFIGDCLADLVRQTYPPDCYEVVVVDDDSGDRTPEIVRAFCAQHPRIRLLTPGPEDAGLSAKKRPMNTGIRASRGEILLTTDADCRVQPTWVAATVACFEPEVGAVVGFSQIDRSKSITLVQKLQGIDFLALMAAAAGAASLGVPLAASGQNLAYRRSLFNAVGGFREIGHRPSGDDVLLLQLMRRAGKGRIVFNAAPEAFNATNRAESLLGLIRQRQRWASNAAYQARLNRRFFGYIVIVFLVNLLIPCALLDALLRGTSLALPLICLGVKTLADFAILLRGAALFRRFDLLWAFPLWAALQPFYVVFIGLAGTLGGIVWKGRRHGPGR